MGDIKVSSSYAIWLKEGGEKDARLRDVILAGLRALGREVPSDARVRIDKESDGMGHVVVTWSSNDA